MNFKWFGAMLIMGSCTAVGFGMAGAYRREEHSLRQLIGALDYMVCELRYRLTPLPELCRLAGSESRGAVGRVLQRISQLLDEQSASDAGRCIHAALAENGGMPKKTEEGFRILGSSLGRFDLDGQVQGLEAARSFCRRELDRLQSGREARLRSYQTLGLCAGAALAILFV